LRIENTDLDRKAFLKVIHKYGPCSQVQQENSKIPTHTEILKQDELRVKSIHSRLSNKLADRGGGDLRDLEASTNIPAKSGSTVGTDSYVVTVGLGTPKKELTLIFDTGSDLTWTQCEPCVGSCHNQAETIFEPRASKTYSNITCSSNLCYELISATGNIYYLYIRKISLTSTNLHSFRIHLLIVQNLSL
jgi:ferredoxin